jgi:hypothetical protein
MISRTKFRTEWEAHSHRAARLAFSKQRDRRNSLMFANERIGGLGIGNPHMPQRYTLSSIASITAPWARLAANAFE